MLSAGKREKVKTVLSLATEVIEITGSAVARSASARRIFDSRDIGNLPSIGATSKDIAKITPEAYVEGDDGQISIGGAK